MSDLDLMNRQLKHIWSEPRFLAWIEWGKTHPSLAEQMMNQLGHDAMRSFAEGNGWPDPEAEVSFVKYDEPDWVLGEPTSEWRRKDAWSRACPR